MGAGAADGGIFSARSGPAPPLLVLVWAGVAQAAPALEAHGSVEQVYATGLAPGAKVTLYDGAGDEVGSKPADELGAVLFREVTPGSGYSLGVGDARSESVRVLTPEVGAAEHLDLRPDDRTARLPVPDHPRRDQAVDRRPPAAGRPQAADRRDPERRKKRRAGEAATPKLRSCRRSRKGARQDPRGRTGHRRPQGTARQSRDSRSAAPVRLDRRHGRAAERPRRRILERQIDEHRHLRTEVLGDRTSLHPDRPDADADRVLRLRLRQPGRSGKRDLADRQPDGLHRRRREHARHRLQRRRLRLLRTAAEPRRLRRGRDDRPPALGPPPRSRDDGDLLRRHQPALHRADAAAGPRRDHAALGDRQHPDDALSGRHPQHRLRARMGEGARPRRRSGGPVDRPGLGLQADPGRRRDLQGKPGAPPGSDQPAEQGQGKRALRAESRRPALAGHLRQEDRRADLHGLPVDRRADRRPLPRPRRALHRHAAEVVHLHQRRPHRLARPGDLQPLARLPRALRGEAAAARGRGGDAPGGAARLPGSDGDPGPDPAARPGAAAADLRRRARRLRSREADPRHLRQRRRRPHARPALPDLRRIVQRIPDPGDEGESLVPGAGREAGGEGARGPAAPTASAGTPTRCRCRTSAATPAPAKAASGRRPRATTGNRPRPARPSPTSPNRWPKTRR